LTKKRKREDGEEGSEVSEAEGEKGKSTKVDSAEIEARVEKRDYDYTFNYSLIVHQVFVEGKLRSVQVRRSGKGEYQVLTSFHKNIINQC
jgi:hypothetical protein